MMDTNSDTNDAHFKIIKADTALCDVVEQHIPTLVGYDTCIHGKKIIDYKQVS